MYLFAKQLLLPPTSLLLVALCGALTVRRQRDVGWWVTIGAMAALYLLAMPLVAERLMAALETAPPLTMEAAAGAQAIVILSADTDQALEYGDRDVGTLTLVRLRYGAWLYEHTHLPILVTGGVPLNSTSSLAAEMSRCLTEEFHIHPRWTENLAQNTWQNAVNSTSMLKADGVERVLLVTHSWHMPRAAAAFRHAGLTVIPAPTAFTGHSPLTPSLVIPSAKALLTSFYALHEMAGALFYALFYRNRATE